jgi:hypothetical protein
VKALACFDRVLSGQDLNAASHVRPACPAPIAPELARSICSSELAGAVPRFAEKFVGNGKLFRPKSGLDLRVANRLVSVRLCIRVEDENPG